jgi:hypothetical protein
MAASAIPSTTAGLARIMAASRTGIKLAQMPAFLCRVIET